MKHNQQNIIPLWYDAITFVTIVEIVRSNVSFSFLYALPSFSYYYLFLLSYLSNN